MFGLEVLETLNDRAAKLAKVGKERTVYSPNPEDLRIVHDCGVRTPEVGNPKLQIKDAPHEVLIKD